MHAGSLISLHGHHKIFPYAAIYKTVFVAFGICGVKSSEDVVFGGGALVSELQLHGYRHGLGGAVRFHMGTSESDPVAPSVGEEAEDVGGILWNIWGKILIID